MDVRTRAAGHHHRGICLLLCARNAQPREVALPSLSRRCVDEADVINAVVQNQEKMRLTESNFPKF